MNFKKLAFSAVSIFLSFFACACSGKYSVKVDKDGVMNFGTLYLDDGSLLGGKFESYVRSNPQKADNVQWERKITVGEKEYGLTLTDVEEVLSSDGKILSRTDKYYKAAGSDDSPKIFASYDHTSGRLLELTVHSSSFFESITAENRIKEVLNGFTAEFKDIKRFEEERISSYSNGEWQDGFVLGAEMYSVTRTGKTGEIHTGNVMMVISESMFTMTVSIPDIEKYRSFLETVTVCDLEKSLQKTVQNRLDSTAISNAGAVQTICIDRDTLYFECMGGKPCFFFSAFYELDGKERMFSAILFLN